MIKQVHNVCDHTDCVLCVSWNHTGTVLASCGADKTIKLWKESNEKLNLINSFGNDEHSRTVRHVSWSYDDQFLASSSFDGTICIWKIDKNLSYSLLTILEGHESEVKCTTWSSNGNLLASCSRDRTIWIWEKEDDESPENFECASILASHSQDIKKVIFHSSDESLISCSYDNSIKLYKEQLDDWCVDCSLNGHSSTVWSVDFNSTGDKFVSCSDDCTIKIWKVFTKDNDFGVSIPKNKKELWINITTLSGYHSRPIFDVSWSKINNYIATASGDNSICIFEETTSSNIDSYGFTYNLVTKITDAHDEDVNCITWNPKNEHILATCSDEGTVKIWKFTPNV